MDRRKLEALLLWRSSNFAWYTGGADNRVDRTSSLGVADVLSPPSSSRMPNSAKPMAPSMISTGIFARLHAFRRTHWRSYREGVV